MRFLSLLFIGIALLIPVSSIAQGCMEGGSEEGVNVVGFIQPEFTWKDINNSKGSEATFAFRRARLGATGSVPYDFTYYFMMEFSPAFENAPCMLDGFITYTRFGDAAKFTFGQFKQPFSLERNMSCSGLFTIYRSLVVEALAIDRDMGLMFLGDYKKKVSYRLAAMNGTGKGEADNNNAKDWIGRVVVSPLDWLHIGGGFRYSVQPSSVATGEEDDKYSRGGIDLQVEYKDFKLITEYIYGKDDGSYTTGGGCEGPAEVHQGSKKRDGAYAMLLWNYKNRIEPVFKYEFYYSDKDEANSKQHVYTFGCSYYFNDWTRLQVNYLRAIEDYTPAKDNDQLLVQMQIKIM